MRTATRGELEDAAEVARAGTVDDLFLNRYSGE
jgi:hypothetical protein